MIKQYQEDGEVILDAGEPKWLVKSVTPNKDYTLDLTFSSGEQKKYDCKGLLNEEIFKPLKNKNLFMQARTNGVTVIWNDLIDIAPETLYADSL